MPGHDDGEMTGRRSSTHPGARVPATTHRESEGCRKGHPGGIRQVPGRGYAVAAAAALPALRPENMHPPRNVPSSERYPCIPPPPKPAASPAA